MNISYNRIDKKKNLNQIKSHFFQFTPKADLIFFPKILFLSLYKNISNFFLTNTIFYLHKNRSDFSLQISIFLIHKTDLNFSKKMIHS